MSNQSIRSVGLFSWRRLIAEHLLECAQHREAINAVRLEIRGDLINLRTEFINSVERMHSENQSAMESIVEEIKENQKLFLHVLKWSASGLIGILVIVIGSLINHFVLTNHL